MRRVAQALGAGLLIASIALSAFADDRARARDLGIAPGILNPGPLNAITDVAGVSVGHHTLLQSPLQPSLQPSLQTGDVRTGATVIRPHPGNVFQDKVPAAVIVANGFGKMAGISQIQELGEIETPIVLTNTLNVPQAMDGVIKWTLTQSGNERVRSVNAVVGETNDGRLNDIRGQHVTSEAVTALIDRAEAGPVAEGSVGAGTGTVAFGWKGGIGTASRILPDDLGGYTLGVLVQSNYGGVLQMDGVPVGRDLGQYYLREWVETDRADRSIMIVLATDAPLSDRNLRRLASRAMGGVARTGASLTNGSGDYVIAFSTAPSVRRTPDRRTAVAQIADLPNARISPLFQAAIEATEEAIYNSLLAATVPEGSEHPALPIDEVREILRQYGR